MIVFNGEQVNGETDESKEVIGWTRARVTRALRMMGDGDALTLNAKPCDWCGTDDKCEHCSP